MRWGPVSVGRKGRMTTTTTVQAVSRKLSRLLAADRPAIVAGHSDPAKAATAAHLRYSSDAEPGIRRTGSPKRFRYVKARGGAVRDQATLSRIRALAIPPAWTD